MGSAAVILHTRSYREGGFLGLGARTMVEVTAADGREVGQQQGKRAMQRRTQAPDAALQPAQPVPASRPVPAAPEPTAGDLIRKTYAAARAEFQQQASPAPTVSSAPALRTVPASRVPVAVESVRSGAEMSTQALASAGAATSSQHDQLAREMAVVRQMVGRLMKQTAGARSRESSPAALMDCDDPLFEEYLSLLNQELAEEIAEEVMHKARQSLQGQRPSAGAQATPAADKAAVRQAIRQALGEFVPVDAASGRLEPTRDGRPRTIALIGPTGVGKTTTLAKLAAIFKLKQQKKVALVTMDTYRIAAVDQLRTYANIIGVPLHVVSSEEEMRQTLKQTARCDAVLIDTAGRSQRDDPRLEDLSRLLRAADPHEVHLVLSSTCTQAAMLDVAERFGRIRADRIIFTKLDEAVSYGVLLNVARKVNKKLSFVTTGQEVPHHIEPLSAGRLADLVLGSGV